MSNDLIKDDKQLQTSPQFNIKPMPDKEIQSDLNLSGDVVDEQKAVEKRTTIKDESDKGLSRNYSLSKLEPISSKVKNQFLIPKENMSKLFLKLASVNRFNTNKEELSTNFLNEKMNKNYDTIGEIKPSLPPNAKHRDTVILDAKLNVAEILNDKNFLLTDDNIIYENYLNNQDFSSEECDNPIIVGRPSRVEIEEKLKGLPDYSNVPIKKPPVKQTKVPIKNKVFANKFVPKTSNPPTRINTKSTLASSVVTPSKKSISTKDSKVKPSLNKTSTNFKASKSLNLSMSTPSNKSSTRQISQSKIGIGRESQSSKSATANRTNSAKVLKENLKVKPFESECQVIDEYDYAKILVDLKVIFGEELEYFDENILFSNLDEMSNKGLIKGLLMLSHAQEKKLRYVDGVINKMKNQHRLELKEKEDKVKSLNEEINKMKMSLKGYNNQESKKMSSIGGYGAKNKIANTKSPLRQPATGTGKYSK